MCVTFTWLQKDVLKSELGPSTACIFWDSVGENTSVSNLTCHWISLLLHTNPFGIEFLWQWWTLSLTPPPPRSHNFLAKCPTAVTATTNEIKDTSIKSSWTCFSYGFVQLLKVCYNQRREKVTSAFLRLQIDYEPNDVCLSLSLSIDEYVLNLIEKCDNIYFCCKPNFSIFLPKLVPICCYWHSHFPT